MICDRLMMADDEQTLPMLSWCCQRSTVNFSSANSTEAIGAVWLLGRK